MSNAHIKPDVKPLDLTTKRDLSEEIALEKSYSRLLKSELARLRAGLADYFINSQKRFWEKKSRTTLPPERTE